MIEAIKSLIFSLELFLRLKNKSFYYDILFKSKNRRKEIIEEIERLRRIGDSNSSDAADILRNELIEENRELEYIRSIIASTQKTNTNKNS